MRETPCVWRRRSHQTHRVFSENADTFREKCSLNRGYRWRHRCRVLSECAKEEPGGGCAIGTLPAWSLLLVGWFGLQRAAHATSDRLQGQPGNARGTREKDEERDQDGRWVSLKLPGERVRRKERERAREGERRRERERLVNGPLRKPYRRERWHRKGDTYTIVLY